MTKSRKKKRAEKKENSKEPLSGLLSTSSTMINVELSRKQKRKNERKLKKMRRNAFHQKLALPSKESIEKEKQKKLEEEKLKKALEKKEKVKKEKKKRKKRKQEQKKQEQEAQKKAMMEAIKYEDREVKKYEKLLRLNKRKSKTISLGFKNDGLDFLLEAVDSDHLQALAEHGDEMEFANMGLGVVDDSDESVEDLTDTKKSQKRKHEEDAIAKKSKIKKVKFEDQNDSDEDSESSKNEFKESKIKKVPFKDQNDSDEYSESSEDEFPDSNSEELTNNDSDEESTAQYTEDIYGRLRNLEGKVVDKVYVPPAKRLAAASSEDEKKRVQIERMKKQLQGLINRLSESNMQGIGNQIEEIFRNHSRMETCTALTEILLGACIHVYLVPERLIMEHCMLLAVLHANVGSEVGANFLQAFASRFKEYFECDNYSNSKELDNLMIILANLYNFRIAHSVLLFDVMKKIADKFGERDIEVLLVILRNIGFSLRKDNPAALKEFIQHIQNKAVAVDTSHFQEKSRVQFMLDTILHIKNNNMRKIPNYDPSHLEHLRKLLRTYTKGASESQLNITLEDLYNAEERGKWWLVGSAWTGRDIPNTPLTKSVTNSALGTVSKEILELARKQRMNTDVRKNIFCIIMTCEDFVDAFEKLLRLGLKHQQEREIIHVITDLCLQEKTYNPFYAYLSQKFCEYDRRFQTTLQFNIWDKFKETNNLGEQKICNLSDLLTHLIATKALSLSIFKVLEFSELDKHRVRLMKRTLTSLLLNYEEHVTIEAFSRIASLQKLQILKEGLKLFVNHFLLRSVKKDKTLDDSKLQLLTSRIELAEKSMGSLDGRFRM